MIKNDNSDNQIDGDDHNTYDISTIMIKYIITI